MSSAQKRPAYLAVKSSSRLQLALVQALPVSCHYGRFPYAVAKALAVRSRGPSFSFKLAKK